MATKQDLMTSIKKGSNIIIDDEPCRVTEVQISKPGKHGHAKVRVSAVGIIDEKKRVIVKPGHDKVDIPLIDKRDAQVLSIQGDSANVMDSETFETFDIKIPEELAGSVADGSNILYWDLVGKKILKQVK
jgi:translation initiation factor 5A